MDHLDKLDASVLRAPELLNSPNEILVVRIGENGLTGFNPNLCLEAAMDTQAGVKAICALLREKKVILEYHI